MNPTSKHLVRIHIGDCYASHQPVIIQTLLGSCVAVCLYDPGMRMGGMNHILLPGAGRGCEDDGFGRYGGRAMEMLIENLVGLGCDRSRLTAKVFGGAHTIPGIPAGFGMGGRNARYVLAYLKAMCIPVTCHQLGGKQHRVVRFHTDTGDAYVRTGAATRGKRRLPA